MVLTYTDVARISVTESHVCCGCVRVWRMPLVVARAGGCESDVGGVAEHECAAGAVSLVDGVNMSKLSKENRLWDGSLGSLVLMVVRCGLWAWFRVWN